MKYRKVEAMWHSSVSLLFAIRPLEFSSTGKLTLPLPYKLLTIVFYTWQSQSKTEGKEETKNNSYVIVDLILLQKICISILYIDK